MKKVLALVLSLVLMLGGQRRCLGGNRAVHPAAQPDLVQSQFRHVYLAQRCIDAGCGEEGDLLYSNKHFKAELYFRFNFSNYRNQCQGGCYSRLYVCAALE